MQSVATAASPTTPRNGIESPGSPGMCGVDKVLRGINPFRTAKTIHTNSKYFVRYMWCILLCFFLFYPRCYFPAPFVGYFTLIDILEKRWSQVGVVPLRATRYHNYRTVYTYMRRVQYSHWSSICIYFCQLSLSHFPQLEKTQKKVLGIIPGNTRQPRFEPQRNHQEGRQSKYR